MKMHKNYSYQFSSNCYCAAGTFARTDNIADTALGTVSVLITRAAPGLGS